MKNNPFVTIPRMAKFAFIIFVGFLLFSCQKTGPVLDKENELSDAIFSFYLENNNQALSDSTLSQIDTLLPKLNQGANRKAYLQLVLAKANNLAVHHQFEDSNDFLLGILEKEKQDHPLDSALRVINAEMHSLLGYNFEKLHRYEISINHSKKAIDYYQSLGLEIAVAREFANQSISYASLGQADRAIKACERGRAILLKQEMNEEVQMSLIHNHNSRATAYNQRAQQQRMMQQTTGMRTSVEEARKSLSKVIDFFDNFQPGSPQAKIARISLGSCYTVLSVADPQYADSSIQILQEVIQDYQQNPELAMFPEYLGYIQGLVGTNFATKKQFRKGVQLIDEGLENLGYFSFKRRYGSEALIRQHPQWLLITSLLGFKSLVHYVWYRSVKQNRHLDLAYSLMDETMAIVEGKALEFSSEQALSSYRSRFEYFFNSYVTMSLLRYNNSQSLADFEKAFQASERYKSFILRQGLKRQILSYELTGKRKKLLQRELELETKRRQLTQQMTGNQGDKAALLDAMLDLQKEEAVFYDGLKNSSSEWEQRYFIDRHDHQLPTLASIRREFLNPQTALIEYHFSGDYPVVFVLTESDQFYVNIELDEAFHQQFNQLIEESIPFENKQTLSTNAHFLYQKLFREIEARLPEQINQLIIVPDNMLRGLPFDLLLSQPTNSETAIEEWPFLLNQYAIGYVYSTQTYALAEQLNARSNNPAKFDFMGFNVSPKKTANLDYFDGCSNLTLPALTESSRIIAQLFDEGQHQVFERAKKKDFLENAPDADVIYLAMHGCIDERPPLDYGLQFYDDQKGLLTVNELLSLPLQARLIVMGSCETATGQLISGEGIASIARAFRQVGGLNLIASLDRVNDEYGAIIYRNFFKEWKNEGEHTLMALAKAKRAFLQNPDIKSGDKMPNKWAGIISIGKPIHWEH